MRSASENVTLTQRQIATLTAQRLSAEACLARAKAELHQVQVNLERTRIISPVDGYVTNLLAQLGDYANVGVNTISVVDALILGRRLFRRDQPGAYPCGGSARSQADGLQPVPAWSR